MFTVVRWCDCHWDLNCQMVHWFKRCSLWPWSGTNCQPCKVTEEYFTEFILRVNSRYFMWTQVKPKQCKNFIQLFVQNLWMNYWYFIQNFGLVLDEVHIFDSSWSIRLFSVSEHPAKPWLTQSHSFFFLPSILVSLIWEWMEKVPLKMLDTAWCSINWAGL